MLPTLSEFNIEPFTFIRKIDGKIKWHPEGYDNNLMERANIASENLFKDPEEIYSLWRVTTNEELYGVLASLTADRNPKSQPIDFLCIKESDLKELNINYEQTSEGKCLKVKSLHFNARINGQIAKQLCYNLMQKETDAQRCPKQKIKLILEYQKNLGCKATKTTANFCTCE